MLMLNKAYSLSLALSRPASEMSVAHGDELWADAIPRSAVWTWPTPLLQPMGASSDDWTGACRSRLLPMPL